MSAFAWISGRALFQELDFTRQAAEMLLEAQDGAGKLHTHVEAGGVLAPERNHVAAEGEIVADKYGEPGAELDGHGFVVGGAQAEGGTAVFRLAVGKLEDPEEDGAVSSEREAFLLDADLVLL